MAAYEFLADYSLRKIWYFADESNTMVEDAGTWEIKGQTLQLKFVSNIDSMSIISINPYKLTLGTVSYSRNPSSYLREFGPRGTVKIR